MASGNSWTKSLFLGLWTGLNFSRKLFFNLIFILIVIFIIVAMTKDDKKVTVPKDGALVLNLYGDLVIEQRNVDPVDEVIREALEQPQEKPEVLLQDVLFAIENAKQDKRIKALVLELQGLGRAGLDKLQQIAAALEDFKSSEKPIYAVSDFYGQNHYYIAAHADHLYLNPMGAVLPEGYGRYRMFYKSAIEKLKAKTHVFRVGTYKSFVEPYIRDDMSEAAKQSARAWLDNLWQQYKEGVARARDIPLNNFDEKIDDFLAKFEQANGDFAQYALDNKWVDALKTREQVRTELRELLGKSKTKRGYNHISYKNYLKVIKPPFAVGADDTDKVGIVVAKGSILDGTQKPGNIGGDSTAALLRRAREDDSIKSVVLYVDSPGGSAFASEIIRQEIEALKAAGKPVVAVMATYAASGGYWISASADKIIAAPTTLTGSIGVFGMFMTFEDSLSHIGIHTDGVATTEFAGISLTRPLNPKIGDVIQRSVEHTYDEFIGLVAKERDMSKTQVDEIAQGRVWLGNTAKELGLVDDLGYLPDAIKAAAELAELDEYDTKYVSRPMSSKDKFLKEIFGQATVILSETQPSTSKNQVVSVIKEMMDNVNDITRMNDPKGLYLHCLICEY